MGALALGLAGCFCTAQAEGRGSERPQGPEMWKYRQLALWGGCGLAQALQEWVRGPGTAVTVTAGQCHHAWADPGGRLLNGSVMPSTPHSHYYERTHRSKDTAWGRQVTGISHSKLPLMQIFNTHKTNSIHCHENRKTCLGK